MNIKAINLASIGNVSFNRIFLEDLVKKGILILLVSVVSILFAIAQPAMPLVWKADHGFKPDFLKNYGPYGDYFVGLSKKEISVIGGEGKTLWSYNFQDKFGFKTASDAHLYGDEVIELDFKPNKKDEELVILINAKTGEELWRTGGGDRSKVDELIKNQSGHTPIDNRILFPSVPEKKNYGSKIVVHPETPFTWGDEVSSEITLAEQNTKVSLSYKRKFLRSSYGNTTKVTISATQENKVLWTTDIEAKIVTTLVSDEDMFDFFISQNKIFVVYEGISVLDLNTGKLLWTSEFNNSEVSVGLKAKQELNIADMPLVTEDAIYIVDLTSETYGIKKCDLETGKVIWKTPKYSGSDVVPFIIMQNGTLLAKFGGIINIQQVISSDNGTTYKSDYKLRGRSGIKAFDSKTGKLLWDEKKLGEKVDIISDFIMSEGTTSFFTDKAFYSIETSSGTLKQKVAIKELDADKIIGVWSNDDNSIAYAVYDGGVFAVNTKEGKMLYELPIRDINGFFKRGNVYFAQIGEDLDKLVAFDLQTGKAISKVNAKKKNVTVDGLYVTTIDWGKIEKYRVK